MRLLRYLLLPIVPMYWLITLVRNRLYDIGIFKSRNYDFPVICVGNLSVGGTGKSPMIEYLIRLLKDKYTLATLSRGYKRKSHGFFLAQERVEVSDIGDEPFQFWKKFPGISLAVDADRVRGIEELLKLTPLPEVLLLDDGFQHRRVNAGLNILLTSYDQLYMDDFMLPTGNLREPIQGAKRAEVIVVTKCPSEIDENEKQSIVKRLKPQTHQAVFFSHISYSEVIKTDQEERLLTELHGTPFSLVTGIANPSPLVRYLRRLGLKFEHHNFPDHHDFRESDFKNIGSLPIITTEKDYRKISEVFKNGDVYYLPIKTVVDKEDQFNKKIIDFCNSYSIGAAEL